MTYTYIRQSQLTRVMPIMVIPVMMKTRSRIPHLLMIITRTIQVAVILPLTRIMAHANKGSTTVPTTAPTTQPAKVLTPGAVVSSTSDTKTTVKDTKGILPDTVKFESKKVTDEKEVAKVADVVKDKIVGVKDVLIYELNLTDGTTQLHQLADKVQVTMDMPFALADNETIKVFRVDSDKLIACTSRVADGKLVFETDHFSTFAFVKVNTNAGTKAAPEGAAKTSDDSNMYMWLVIAMAGLGVSIAALMNRKKEQA